MTELHDAASKPIGTQPIAAHLIGAQPIAYESGGVSAERRISAARNLAHIGLALVVLGGCFCLGLLICISVVVINTAQVIFGAAMIGLAIICFVVAGKLLRHAIRVLWQISGG